MKLTGYGRKEWLGALVVLIFFLVICAALFFFADKTVGIALGIVALICWTAFAAFFRDPVRKIPKSPLSIVSPADGLVRDIELIPAGSCDNEALKELFAGKDLVRVGIFLSVLDVHLNRAPCAMKVKFTLYKKGCFHDARDARASKENESMLIGGTGSAGNLSFPVAVRQISGAIARRIVCGAVEGGVLAKGERFGMIKFGSRTELYLPVKSGIELAVSVGDRTVAGETVMAKCCEKLDAAIINLPGENEK